MQINYTLIYCYFNTEIYINWCFVDVMKIHPTPSPSVGEGKMNASVQVYTSLFPLDMIQDIYILHWNLIHKLIGVAWNVGTYKLIRLPGHPNLDVNLTYNYEQ